MRDDAMFRIEQYVTLDGCTCIILCAAAYAAANKLIEHLDPLARSMSYGLVGRQM